MSSAPGSSSSWEQGRARAKEGRCAHTDFRLAPSQGGQPSAAAAAAAEVPLDVQAPQEFDAFSNYSRKWPGLALSPTSKSEGAAAAAKATANKIHRSSQGAPVDLLAGSRRAAKWGELSAEGRQRLQQQEYEAGYGPMPRAGGIQQRPQETLQKSGPPPKASDHILAAPPKAQQQQQGKAQSLDHGRGEVKALPFMAGVLASTTVYCGSAGQPATLPAYASQPHRWHGHRRAIPATGR